MLTINATLENGNVVISGLQELAAEMPDVLRKVLTTAAIGTHRESFKLLSGSATPAGAYPVPIITGNLRRLLDWLKPGENKGVFKAGGMEAIIYSSTPYSGVIHEGRGSSAKFGARPFITDGFKRFNEGDKLVHLLEDEVEKAARKKGFK